MSLRRLLASFELHGNINKIFFVFVPIDALAGQEEIHFTLEAEEFAAKHVFALYYVSYLQKDVAVLIYFYLFTLLDVSIIEIDQIFKSNIANLDELDEGAIDKVHVI